MIKKLVQQLLFVILTFQLFLVEGFSQDQDSFENIEVSLDWKINMGDTIAYKTLMQNSDIEPLAPSGLQKMIEGTEMGKNMKENLDNTNLVTYLTESEVFNNVIDVEMVGIPKERIEEEKEDFFNMMLTGTLLRGTLYKSGGIHSFWVKRAQMNLVSMFFELPTKKVKIGDSWKLNSINLIGNDQNFICKKADRVNVVTLKDLRMNEGDTIAILEYEIREFVSGQFSMNTSLKQFNLDQNDEMSDALNSMAKKRDVELDYRFSAIAEFSITKGKWKSFNGVISTKSIGFMGNNALNQTYALKELK